jgi:Ni/Fe-hydrogenase 1 B-type cytochrome subunit
MTPRVDDTPGMKPTGQRPLHLSSDVPAPSGNYRWVYLWQWPIRAMHWAAAASIVVLAVTGFMIGKPWFITSGEASAHYYIGFARLTHFIAAGVLVATAVVRVYWLFAGNQFERLKALFPVRPRDWKNMVKMVKYYLMIDTEGVPHYLGHNPMQQLSYTGMYLAGATMVVTGFAMYGQSNPGGFIWTLFHWVPNLVGGLQMVRSIHHVMTWAFLIFIPIHVYLALRAEIMERTGTISSIVSGGRFVPKDEHYVDD